MKPTLKAFHRFVGEDLKPIALHPGTKIPILKGWTDWHEIENRELIKRPLTNVGILLGDIIDVEGDSKKANDTVIRLIGDYPHPVYKSQKSFHHLFINPDPDLRILKHENIEFRGKGHQSVIPPSVVDGTTYAWVNEQFPIPKMPEELLAFYNKLKTRYSKVRVSMRAGHKKPYCSICKERQFIHDKRWRIELMAFKEIDLSFGWQCHKCRQVDLRDRVRQIRKEIRNENISDWRDWLRWKESHGNTARSRA